ncbi:hypothetical protein NECID01_1006 [Nematocida sp. AWRm77]|nr:hypothetical protein NECID01_1006 [Nematocida sp. AWRm77]
MDILLEKKACAAIDSGVCGKFESLVMLAKPSGLYIQGRDGANTIVVEHHVDKALFKSYVPSRSMISIPHVKTEIAGMDTLHMFTEGLLLKMVWSCEGIVFERSVYLLDIEEVNVDYQAPSVHIQVPVSLFYLVLRLAESALEVSLDGREAEIKSTRAHPDGLFLSTTIPAVSSVPCTFTLQKPHLDRLPRYALYTAAQLSMDERGMAVLVLEGMGVLTSITMSTEVVFLNAH